MLNFERIQKNLQFWISPACGKSCIVMIFACMRKMLHNLVRMLNSRKCFTGYIQNFEIFSRKRYFNNSASPSTQLPNPCSRSIIPSYRLFCRHIFCPPKRLPQRFLFNLPTFFPIQNQFKSFCFRKLSHISSAVMTNS